LQDVAATETRKLEWVDEEEIGSASNEIAEPQSKYKEEESDDDDDDDEPADER
jgi:hypothetical protein